MSLLSANARLSAHDVQLELGVLDGDDFAISKKPLDRVMMMPGVTAELIRAARDRHAEYLEDWRIANGWTASGSHSRPPLRLAWTNPDA